MSRALRLQTLSKNSYQVGIHEQMHVTKMTP